MRGTVHLRILWTGRPIEVFVDDGRYVHSSQVFAASRRRRHRAVLPRVGRPLSAT